MASLKFVHDLSIHNVKSPTVIVPLLLKCISPKSIVDIGCGTGRFLKIFKEHGIKDVLGVDGKWVNRQMLHENLDASEFFESDLDKFTGTSLERKFDLAMCLEVAEHVDERYANQLVNSLTELSQYVLFSAAIPLQGGQKHINEQWPSYWQEKFARHDYVFWDVLRMPLWNSIDVQYWFKQNLFLVVHKDEANFEQAFQFDPQACYNYIHPELFTRKAKLLNDVLKGNYPLMGYLRLFAKALFKKIGLS